MIVFKRNIFNQYSIPEKAIFEAFRNAMIKIIHDGITPLEDEFIIFAENSAIEFVNKLPFEYVELNKVLKLGGGAAPTTNSTSPILGGGASSGLSGGSSTGGTGAAAGGVLQTLEFEKDIFVLKLKDNV